MASDSDKQATQAKAKGSSYKASPDNILAFRPRGSNTFGSILFTVLRILDVLFQAYLLSGAGFAFIKYLGGLPTIADSSQTVFGLSPYDFLIFGLAVGSAAKQIYWNSLINQQFFSTGLYLGIAAGNWSLNTMNTLLTLWSWTSQQPRKESSASSALVVGVLLYAIGLLVEWYSEIQRSRFKAQLENQGKPHADGLFGYARNINYGGYTLWRTGYCLACGGWLWGVFNAAWLSIDFANRAIPDMDAYCEKRYGKLWEEVRRKVPYKLLPWIY